VTFSQTNALTPSSPAQDLASYFRSIESLILKPSTQAWRLLDADDESRVGVADWLEHQQLNPPAQGRFRALSFFFDKQALSINVGVNWSRGGIEKCLDEAKARLLKSIHSEECLVSLISAGPSTFEIKDCMLLKKSEISDAERVRLQRVSLTQQQRDFAAVKGKIGRNDLCPCGSGLKYKKCCLRSRQAKSSSP